MTPTNASLFAVEPAIAADGTLTYTPAADANGTSTVSVKLTDDGGTGNGGDDESATQTFTITVTPVNDVPSFTKGPDESAPERVLAGADAVRRHRLGDRHLGRPGQRVGPGPGLPDHAQRQPDAVRDPAGRSPPMAT